MSVNLLLFVEGRTEEEFAREILFPHLGGKGILCHPPILVANSVRGGWTSRGGVRSYGPLKTDIKRRLKQYGGDDFRFTTLVDLYGLPNDFPGKSKTPTRTTGRKQAEDVAAAWQRDIPDRRFSPFVFSYEFEALVLSKPESLLAAYPEAGKEISALKADIAGLAPEDINDSFTTAPSKRISKHLHNYDKAYAGPLAIMEIGLDEIRSRCPHFNEWMTAMENLS